MDELSPELKARINAAVKRNIDNWKRIKRILNELNHERQYDSFEDKAPKLIKEMAKLLQEMEQ